MYLDFFDRKILDVLNRKSEPLRAREECHLCLGFHLSPESWTKTARSDLLTTTLTEQRQNDLKNYSTDEMKRREKHVYLLENN
jgi:hypothetical protein